MFRPSQLLTLVADKAERFTRPGRVSARWHNGHSYHLELAGPILIRHSRADDRAALQQLAELDSRTLPEGSFLLAEVGDELVAAAPLDIDCEPLKDPYRPTANVRELLELQARYIRRSSSAAIQPKTQFSDLVHSADGGSITVARTR